MCMNLYMYMCAHVYWPHFRASDYGVGRGLSMHMSLYRPGSMCVNPNTCLFVHVWLWVRLHLCEPFVCEGWICGISERG